MAMDHVPIFCALRAIHIHTTLPETADEQMSEKHYNYCSQKF